MAIRLDELFDKTKRTFELKLIAGKGGLNHIVGWVHLLEDEIILNRFGGQELAVTTGMKSQEPDWLLHVVTSMKKRDCSGLILNTGMYLKNIPQSVIDWCNQNDFPLFAMPWEISCTQLVQEFCTIIMKRAQKEREYGDIFQSIIQGAPLNSELFAPLKNRFQTDSTFPGLLYPDPFWCRRYHCLPSGHSSPGKPSDSLAENQTPSVSLSSF